MTLKNIILGTLILGGLTYGQNVTAKLEPVQKSWTQLVLENVPPSEETKKVYNTVVKTEKFETSEPYFNNYESTEQFHITNKNVDKYNALNQLVEREGRVIPDKNLPMCKYKFKITINRNAKGEVTSQIEFRDGSAYEKEDDRYERITVIQYVNGETSQLSQYHDEDGDGYYESSYDGLPSKFQYRVDKNKDGIPDLTNE